MAIANFRGYPKAEALRNAMDLDRAVVLGGEGQYTMTPMFAVMRVVGSGETCTSYARPDIRTVRIGTS